MNTGTPRKGRSFYRQTASLYPGLCLYALIGLCVWVYWPGLGGPFLFDDFGNLQGLDANGNIDDWRGLFRYLGGSNSGPTGRPIALLSFLLNASAWPADPWPFKYTNLLIHALNGVLVFWCSLKICRLNSLSYLREQADWLALAAAGLWLLHPMQVATTLYVIQRMTLLSALFSLCGLLLYLHGREMMQTRPTANTVELANEVGRNKPAQAGVSGKATAQMPETVASRPYSGLRQILNSTVLTPTPLPEGEGLNSTPLRPQTGYACITVAVGLCTLLAVLSKENGVLLPLLLAVVEFTVLRHQCLLVRHPHRFWTLPFFGVPALATAIYLGRLLLPYQAAAFAPRGFTALERGLTEARVLMTYLYQLAIPKLYSGSLFNDDYPLSTGLLTPPTTLLALVAIGLLLGIAYRTRQTYPLVSLAVLFFFVGHLLESTLVPLDVYYEHRNYLPSVFLFLPLAYASARHTKVLAYGVVGLLLLVAGFTAAKAKLWGNEQELLLVWAKQHPDSVRGQRYLANSYLKMGQYGQSLAILRATTYKHPEDFRLRLHQMIVSCLASQPDFENVSNALQQAKAKPVYFDSRDYEMLDQLVGMTGESKCPGLTLDRLLDITDSLLSNPAVKDSVNSKYLLKHIKGCVALQRNDAKAALEHFSTALQLVGDPEVGLLETALLASHGFYPEALRQLQATESLLHARRPPASEVFNKHDYPMEINRLRKNILEDMAHQ